jgi:hypothetical protein
MSPLRVEIEPETIRAKGEVLKINLEGGARWNLNPSDRPIKTVTPIREYFDSWHEGTAAMMGSLWDTDWSTSNLRGCVEYLTEDDQYACYEYATKDQYPNNDEFDEWRAFKSDLHRVHLEAGKEIPMSEKVLQAIAILPGGPASARATVIQDVREVLMNIVRFNLDVRGKYPYSYDLDSTA